MNPRIKDIFFDLDRTLWDFESNSKETLQELFHNSELAQHIKHFESFHHTYRNVNADLWQRYGKQKITKEELRDTRFLKVLEHFEINNRELALQLSHSYIEESPRKTNLFPGAIDTLAELKNRGFRMHIITNGFVEVQYVKLKNSGLEPFFDIIVCSEHIGVNKPDPRIFTHALKEASAQANTSVMIGDDLEVDVLGANRAGMDAILFDPAKRHKSRAFRVINQLEELLLPIF